MGRYGTPPILLRACYAMSGHGIGGDACHRGVMACCMAKCGADAGHAASKEVREMVVRRLFEAGERSREVASPAWAFELKAIPGTDRGRFVANRKEKRRRRREDR